MTTIEIVNDTLKVLKDEPIHGGQVSDNVFDKILLNLQSNSQVNKVMLYGLFGLILISFVIVCYVIFQVNDNLTLVISLIGGEGTSLVVLINIMRNIYRDKIASDLLFVIIPTLVTTEEKIEYMKTVRLFLEQKK